MGYVDAGQVAAKTVVLSNRGTGPLAVGRVIVSEVNETAHLFRSEANKERLLKAVENVEKGGKLVEVRIGDLQ